jgi:hypothetical protein
LAGACESLAVIFACAFLLILLTLLALLALLALSALFVCGRLFDELIPLSLSSSSSALLVASPPFGGLSGLPSRELGPSVAPSGAAAVHVVVCA